MSVCAPVGDANICPLDTICIDHGLAAIRVNQTIEFKYLYQYISSNATFSRDRNVRQGEAEKAAPRARAASAKSCV
jgi:hypothetical protein